MKTIYLQSNILHKHVIYKRNIVKSSLSMPIIKSSVNWFGWTVVYNIFNKHAILELDTQIVTSSQLAISTLMCMDIKKPSIDYKILKKWTCMLFLLGFGQYLGNLFGNLATLYLNVSSVNIIKSSEPIISMIIMYILFKQTQSVNKTILTIPIILGIVLCNNGDITYNTYGIFLCTLSNIFHIFKIIVTKKYFVEELNYDGKTLFLLSMFGSFMVSLPILSCKINLLYTLSHKQLLYLLLSSIGYYYNSIYAFDLITKLSPVAFSTMNIYKRIVSIISLFIYENNIPNIQTIFGLLLTNICLYLYLI